MLRTHAEAQHATHDAGKNDDISPARCGSARGGDGSDAGDILESFVTEIDAKDALFLGVGSAHLSQEILGIRCGELLQILSFVGEHEPSNLFAARIRPENVSKRDAQSLCCIRADSAVGQEIAGNLEGDDSSKAARLNNSRANRCYRITPDSRRDVLLRTNSDAEPLWT